MSLPSSYQRGQSSSTSHSYQYQEIPGPSEDSGFKDSPISHSVSPPQDVPPPIRLDKHPSFRKQRSMPCRIQRTSRSSISPSGSYGASSSHGHCVGSFNDEEMFDERAMSRQSASPPDDGYSEENEELGSGQFRMDPDVTGEHHQYETMRHPSLNGQQVHEEYIKMVPAVGNGMPIHKSAVPSNYDVPAVPRPAVPSNYDVPPPFRKRNGESPVSSSPSPSNYENSGPLPTIQEAPKPPRGRSEVYENVGSAHLREEEFVHYRRNYENSSVHTDQRQSSETYQNVVLIGEDPPPPFRSRTRSMEKGQYTPPRSKNPPHLHYAQRQSPCGVSPPVPPRVPVVGATAD